MKANGEVKSQRSQIVQAGEDSIPFGPAFLGFRGHTVDGFVFVEGQILLVSASFRSPLRIS